MDIETFRKSAHAFADWMADYLASVENYPVRAQTKHGDIAAQIEDACPERGEDIDAIFEDFKSIIMPGMTHWQHPRFFAYFTGNSSPPSVLAEMLTATLAAQCMLWETSPAANELETRMMEWLRDLIGLPKAFQGTIQDSASTATLCALIAARQRVTKGGASRKGLNEAGNLVVYTSEEAHSSIAKGAMVAGFGLDHVRKIALQADLGMDPGALTAAIHADRRAGLVPTAIVASLGATGVGAVDPLRAVGEVARAEKLFLHLDAAWAGSALILPENRKYLDGAEYIDSFVFNPHKWLMTNFDCSALYLRDPAELIDALAITPTYLESAHGGNIPEYRDWSIPLGRRFRALKLWFVLRSYGAEALREKIRSDIASAQRLAETISKEPDFELTTEPRFSLLTFRYKPAPALAESDLDALNEKLVKRINDDGRVYLTKTRLGGKLVIRFAIGQTYTEERHVKEGWSVVKEIAAGL